MVRSCLRQTGCRDVMHCSARLHILSSFVLTASRHRFLYKNKETISLAEVNTRYIASFPY